MFLLYISEIVPSNLLGCRESESGQIIITDIVDNMLLTKNYTLKSAIPLNRRNTQGHEQGLTWHLHKLVIVFKHGQLS